MGRTMRKVQQGIHRADIAVENRRESRRPPRRRARPRHPLASERRRAPHEAAHLLERQSGRVGVEHWVVAGADQPFPPVVDQKMAAEGDTQPATRRTPATSTTSSASSPRMRTPSASSPIRP